MSCELPLRGLGATAQGCVEAVDLGLDLALWIEGVLCLRNDGEYRFKGIYWCMIIGLLGLIDLI